jgi:hypothetical protein
VALRAAFIFLAPGADGAKHRATVRTPQVELTVVGVADYAAAERTAQSLVAQGIAAIELCGGFGVAGTARIAAAVAGRAAVGAVRFDAHPGLHWKSGDEVFAA